MTPQALARQESFFQSLNITIEAHLDDPTFNVKKLLRILGISRTDLHRKLHCQIGMSITKYIRYVRLKKASYLLLKHLDWNICQVALEVGFNSQSYFTKRFREVFGVCPVEFREQERILEHM